jgi:hypothetical protein
MYSRVAWKLETDLLEKIIVTVLWADEYFPALTTDERIFIRNVDTYVQNYISSRLIRP